MKDPNRFPPFIIGILFFAVFYIVTLLAFPRLMNSCDDGSQSFKARRFP